MRARQATFAISSVSPDTFPPETAPEIAFTGRSNVGKSSLINSLVGVRGLARTSGTPGRTQMLNWFAVTPPFGPDHLAFVDFPGYGYAKVPTAVRAAFGPLVDAYLENRRGLRLVIVILDARRGAEEDERLYVDWLAEHSRPTLVVLTKVDKLSKSKRIPAQSAARAALGLARAPLLYSAETGEGVKELWRAIVQAV